MTLESTTFRPMTAADVGRGTAVSPAAGSQESIARIDASPFL
jgi:hypothetical protein